MGSTDSERSISSGISIPQWMKSKIADRYDIEETFSPPTHDDTFFYIRYPKSKPAPQPGDDNYRAISDVLEEKPLKQRDFSKHTQPCKEFIPEVKNLSENNSPAAMGTMQVQAKVNKSQGTDDGYMGEAAACGKSVVQVAQQMIAGNRLTLRGTEQAIPQRRRRNSKSLPATPIASPNVSPKLQRKKQGEPHNRYFTGVFGVPAQYPGSWILSGVLGQRDIAAQQSSIQEPASENMLSEKGKQSEVVRRNKSSSSLLQTTAEGSKDEDQASSDGESSPGLVKKEMVFRAKPSEFREMNFLSPTSM